MPVFRVYFKQTMYKKMNRFHGHGSIRWVLSKGKTSRGRNMSLRYDLGQGGFKVAVVVSKKVAKSAAVRNRIRRRVYAAAKELLPPATSKGSYVFLVYVGDIAILPYADVRAQVAKLLPPGKDPKRRDAVASPTE